MSLGGEELHEVRECSTKYIACTRVQAASTLTPGLQNAAFPAMSHRAQISHVPTRSFVPCSPCPHPGPPTPHNPRGRGLAGSEAPSTARHVARTPAPHGELGKKPPSVPSSPPWQRPADPCGVQAQAVQTDRLTPGPPALLLRTDHGAGGQCHQAARQYTEPDTQPVSRVALRRPLTKEPPRSGRGFGAKRSPRQLSPITPGAGWTPGLMRPAAARGLQSSLAPTALTAATGVWLALPPRGSTAERANVRLRINFAEKGLGARTARGTLPGIQRPNSLKSWLFPPDLSVQKDPRAARGSAPRGCCVACPTSRTPVPPRCLLLWPAPTPPASGVSAGRSSRPSFWPQGRVCSQRPGGKHILRPKKGREASSGERLLRSTGAGGPPQTRNAGGCKRERDGGRRPQEPRHDGARVRPSSSATARRTCDSSSPSPPRARPVRSAPGATPAARPRPLPRAVGKRRLCPAWPTRAAPRSKREACDCKAASLGQCWARPAPPRPRARSTPQSRSCSLASTGGKPAHGEVEPHRHRAAHGGREAQLAHA